MKWKMCFEIPMSGSVYQIYDNLNLKANVYSAAASSQSACMCSGNEGAWLVLITHLMVV